MRRWFAGCAAVFVLVAVLFGGTGAVLAYVQPAAPGHALYPIQNRITQGWIQVHAGGMRARLALQYLARHVVWLEETAGTSREEAALRAYDQALRFTAQHLMHVPEEEWPVYREQWTRLNRRALKALDRFRFLPRQQPELWRQARAKVEAVLESIQTAQSLPRRDARGILAVLQAPLPSSQGEKVAPSAAPKPQTTATPWTTPMPVAFPTEFVQRHQQFFPLTGAHATLDCTSCHAGGRFAGTNDTCLGCHTQDQPSNHWNMECSLCHSTTAWTPANFNHQAANATNCQTCHAQDRPPNHFQGQCSSCHATTAWKPARFDHQAANATDCQACHAQDRPPNHFQGQCSSCHATTAWKPANFNHTFPIDHGGANGKCSVCHPGGTDGYTCTTCHDMNKLVAEHQEEGIVDFVGKCVSCHANGDEHDGHGDDRENDDDHEDDGEDEDEDEDEDHGFRGNQSIAFTGDTKRAFVSSGLLTTNLLLVGGLWLFGVSSLRRR